MAFGYGAESGWDVFVTLHTLSGIFVGHGFDLI
jgi:hypothetical protein